MVINFGALQIFVLLAPIFALLIACILLFRKKKVYNKYNLYLGLSFLFLSLGLFIAFLNNSGLIILFPFAARWGNFLVLLFMPFSYFYFRANIKNIPFRFTDCVHFLPALFYFVDYLPFFLMSSEEKLVLIEGIINNTNIKQSFGEGWISPPWFDLILRYAVILFYWILQLRLLIIINAIRTPQFLQENKHWLNWAWIYQILQAFYFIPAILYVILDNATLDLNIFAEITPAASLFILCVYLFFRPEILYGIAGIIYDHNDNTDPNEQRSPEGEKVGYKKYLSNQQVEEIISKLQKSMEIHQPYLINGYTIKDLSNDLDVQTWLLSTVLNKKLKMNFNEYLNKYRIDYCLQMIHSDDYKTKTLEALSMECGFNNRNSFLSAFKHFQHKTPSEYIKYFEAGKSAKN
jgi:AraC-like DNA-binding protein